MNSNSATDPDTLQSSYRVGKMLYRIATRTDDATLRAILRDTPMTSWITLSSEHEPDYFRSARLFGQRKTLIAQRHGAYPAPVGMCSWSTMPLFIDGLASQIGYLGELRLLPEFRSRPGIVRNGFRALRALAPDYPHWFTSIAVDNRVARRLLEAGLKGMPTYRQLGEMVTMALPSASRRSQTTLHACTPEEVPELVNFFNHQAQHFQYAPVLSETWLRQLDGSNGLRLHDFQLIRRGGRLCACFALWDQRSLKQTVVRGYRFPLAQLRSGYNLLARLGGRLTLPPVGQAIDYLFIAFLATAPDLEASAFRRLVDSALALTAQRRIPCAMLGLATDNPRLQSLARYRAQTYRTCIESVTWPDQVVAGMAPDQPRAERIIQPEVALL